MSMDGVAPDGLIMGARLRPGRRRRRPCSGPCAGRGRVRVRGGGPLQGNVLLLSQRRISDLVAYCMVYEFEDALTAVTGAQRIDATDLPALEFSRRAYKLARFATGSPRLARRLAPYPSNKVVLQRDYELFFPMFSHAYELYALASIPNWRQRCHKAACFITEVWSEWLPEYLVEMLVAIRSYLCRNTEQRRRYRPGFRPAVQLPAARCRCAAFCARVHGSAAPDRSV